MENELWADDQNRLRNISMQTGEEFSPTFLKDRVASRRTPVANDVDQILTSKPGFDVVQNHHLTALRSIKRRDSETFTDYSDVSPGKGYGFDRGSPSSLSIYSSGSPNFYQFSGRGSGVMDGSFSGKIKFLCSFGGRILPRPNDGSLRYVGGDTRIMSIRKNTTYLELMKTTMAICNYPHTIKYQLPGEDLDALISVSSDEDLHHMIEEYYELEKSSQRLRIFLVSCGDSEQQSDAGCPYVVAVNGMLEVSHQRSFSRESLESQWDSPAPSRLVENQSEGNASNLKLALSSPQVPTKSYMPPPPLSHHQDAKTSYMKGYEDAKSLHNYAKNSLYVMDSPSNDNPCHFDASGHYQNNATDALPVVGSPNQKSYFVQQHAIPQVGSHFSQPIKEFHPPLLYVAPNYSGAMRGFPNVVDVVPSQDTFCFSPDIYRRENIFLPEEKSGYVGAEEKSSSIEMSSSSQEEVVEVHIAHDKYQPSKNKDQYYSECARDSIQLRKNNAMCYDQDSKNYASDRDYVLNGYLEHKNNLPSMCLPESQVNRGKVSSSSAENLAAFWKGLPENYQIRPNEPEFLIKSQKESSDLKHIIPHAADFNAAIIGSHVLHPVSASGNNQTQFISPFLLPESSSGFCVKDPIDFLEKTTNGSLGREVSCQKEMVCDYYEGLVNDSHKSGKKVRPDKNYREEYSNNCRETSTLEKPVMVDLSDEVESPGDKTEAESHLYESGGNDVEVDEESKGESLGDAALMEMKASLHGLQIIRNSDLEDLQELGSGTFGTVYHGKWRGTDVAIKRIKKSCFSGRSSEQEKLTNDFWREAKILSGLHHPNIVAFYGVVPDGPGGTLATVTEYLVNGSLRRVLLRKDRALDPRKKVIIALEAAFGMEYLHLKNIVHFDLKCDNLLVNLGDPQRPVCKVGDFGLSRIKQKTLVSGGVRGTLPWMAPELLNGNSARVSEKVDVFSFGIAMWEILTGEEPYINLHCGVIIGGIVTNTLRPAIPERCDPEWKRLMEECWSHEPEARPSFTEITNRLRVMSKALQPKRFNRVRR